CNKTYYGDIGRTYEVELHRPREDLVPYVCLLTITAAGGMHGDLVQVGVFSFKYLVPDENRRGAISLTYQGNRSPPTMRWAKAINHYTGPVLIGGLNTPLRTL
ncbi:jg13329, partial [Pararge aegeria aegeria]